MKVQHVARLHESTVQQIAGQCLSKAQRQHATSTRWKQHTEGESVVAQKVSVVLVDDLDGTEAHETVTFGLDGSTYEIDLNKEHAEDLRLSIESYTKAARKVNGRPKSKGKAGDTRAVREWARANGFEVSTRGVVPAQVRAAYAAAH